MSDSEPDHPESEEATFKSKSENFSVLNNILSAISPEFVAVFQEHEIDLEAALLLEDEELKELFPKIGQRLKFKKKIDSLKDKQTSKETSQNPCIDTTKAKSKQDTLDLTSQRDLSQQEIAKSTFTYQDEYTVEFNEDGQVSKDHNSVFKILNASLDGRAILKEGQIGGGCLKEGARRKLSQLIIAETLDASRSKVIPAEEFQILATEICDLFQKESAVVYFSPYTSGSSGNAKKNASGKLYETYISRRRKLRENGDLPQSNRSSSVSTSTSTTSSQQTASLEDLEEEYQESLSWLKNNVDPWEHVLYHWEATAEARLGKVKEGLGKIDLKDIPALQQPLGYTLLLKDFDQLYPEKRNNLFSKIILKKDNILQYARTKLKSTRDKYLKIKLAELLSLVKDTNPESLTNISLMVLPLIINISPTRKHKKSWKPSRSEISDGFVAQATTEAEVTNFIIEKREKFSKLGLTVQPYVIFLGPSAAEIRKAYVVINEVTYAFQKLITAVDTAFKVFQATGAYYPDEAEDIWTAIQIGLYEISTKFDRQTQAVNTFLSDVQLLV